MPQQPTTVAPGGPRTAIANLSWTAGVNPYLSLLYGELARLGLPSAPEARFTLRWLWRARGEVGFLHFGWAPDDHYVWMQLHGLPRRVLSWLRLGAFAARLVAARALGYRIVWTIHELHPPGSRVSRRLDLAAARLLARASHVLVAHHPALAARARAELGPAADGIELVAHGSYAGVYPKGRDRAAVRAELGIAPQATVFLCFGGLREDKAIDLLLEAFRALANPQAVLVVAGPVIEQPIADAVTTAAVADPRIRPLLGLVPKDRVAQLHDAADTAVLARSELWTSGSIVLALSLGLPVVAARLPPHEDLIGRDERAGWLFDPGDAPSLGRALERAAADPTLHTGKRDSAFEQAEAIAPWSQIAQAMADLLRH